MVVAVVAVVEVVVSGWWWCRWRWWVAMVVVSGLWWCRWWGLSGQDRREEEAGAWLPWDEAARKEGGLLSDHHSIGTTTAPNSTIITPNRHINTHIVTTITIVAVLVVKVVEVVVVAVAVAVAVWMVVVV